MGGYNIDFKPLNTSDSVTRDIGGITPGVQLPFNLAGHCVASWQKTEIAVVGGSGYSNQLWISGPGGWARGPDLNSNRFYHGCVTIQDENGNDVRLNNLYDSTFL